MAGGAGFGSHYPASPPPILPRKRGRGVRAVREMLRRQTAQSAGHLTSGASVFWWRSRPISRVLSWTVIPLGASSPIRSSSLPGPDAGRVMRSLFGLAPGGVCRAGLLPGSRCALTAPFHPCHASEDRSAVSFCCTFRRLAPPRRYLAPCPVEPGLSSAPARLHDPMTRLSGRLRRAHCRTRPTLQPYSLPYSALRGAPLSSAASLAAAEGGRCSASFA